MSTLCDSMLYRSSLLLLTLFVGASLSTPGHAAVVVVDFDSEPTGVCLPLGASLSTQGFTFTSPTSSLFSCDGTAVALASNGTASLIDANFFSTPTMVEESGRPFTLHAFDAADRNVSGAGNATSIEVQGTRLDGSIVTASFPLDGINDGPGGVADFETFVLPQSFAGLTSVTFEAQPPVARSEFLIDDIVVEAATVVDFESAPTSSCQSFGASLSTQGFTFTSPTSSLFSCDGTNASLASNGTASLIDANFFSAPTMVEESGRPFTLHAFDAAERNASGAGNATSIEVQGTRLDGSIVTASFPLDGINDGPGGVADFETFVLPLSFTGLTSVTFEAQPPVARSEFLIDDIVVEAATVVDFESAPTGDCQFFGASLSTQSFTFTSPTGSLFSCDGTLAFLASNGTASLIDANSFSTPTMVEESGLAFDLLAFDAAERNVNGVGNATSIEVQGTRFDGSVVTTSFPLDGIIDGPGGVADFETFVLPGSFNRLVSVTFEAQPAINPSEFLIDDIAVVQVVAPVVPASEVVDFESAPTGTCQGFGASLSTQGFTFTSPTNSLFSCDGTVASIASNGTASLIDANTFSEPTMVTENGAFFGLLSFDAAGRSNSVGASAIRIEGTRWDGSLVVANFPLDGVTDGPGGAEDFETLILPASFSFLSSVTFEAQPPVDPSEFLLDNLAVPEPSITLGLLAGAATLSGLARRRRRQLPPA